MQIKHQADGQPMDEGQPEEEPRERYTQTRQASPQSRSKTPILEHFGRDLTAMARAGKLDPIIGREEEIERTLW